MWWLILLLLMFGVALIILEILVPYGLAAIAGGIVIVASMIICFQTYGLEMGLLYSLVGLLIGVIACVVVFRKGVLWLSLKPASDLPPEWETAGPPKRLPSAGELAQVIQPLRPTGTIVWQNRRLPARTLKPEMELKRGATVQIKGSDSIYILVEPARQGQESATEG